MTIAAFNLDDAHSHPRAGIGGKASALAQLRARGFPIPDAYVFPVDVVTRAPSSTFEGLLKPVLSKLAPPWIVRSSATVEDGREAAFAGIFKTVLGLETIRDVADAMAVVLASANEGAARGYVRHLGLPPGKIGMAVIVQHMLLPFASGVAFTRHPMDGRDVTAIEAIYGLGSTLVDGQVEPDFVEVDLRSRVSFVRIGSKLRKSVLHAGAVTTIDVEESERARPAITHAQARNVASLARRAEAEFADPQDIEWAIESDVVYLVQSRPITRLFQAVPRASHAR